MFVDNCSQNFFKCYRVAVNTSATGVVYSDIFDMKDFRGLSLSMEAEVLTGSGAAKYIKLVDVQTSDVANLSSGVTTYTATDYFINGSGVPGSDNLTRMNLTVVGVEKKIGLTDIVANGNRYVRFTFEAGTDASYLLYVILKSGAKNSPVAQ